MVYCDQKQINESKTDNAYRAIEAKILSLEFGPGAWISETELCQLLKLGRTPVREALIKLSLSGLVEILPRRGIRVADIDARNYFELIEVRKTLSHLLIRAATQRATPQQRAAMLALSHRLKNLEQDPSEPTASEYSGLSLEAWRLISEAARNPIAERLMEPLMGLANRMSALYGIHDERAALSMDLMDSSVTPLPDQTGGTFQLFQEKTMAALAELLLATADRQTEKAIACYGEIEHFIEQGMTKTMMI